MNKCMTCGERLLAGKPYVSLCLHRETCDGNEVQVIEANVLQIWCESCALGVFGSVCYEGSCPQQSSEDKEVEEMLAFLFEDDVTEESRPSADPMNTIKVYLAGLEDEDPNITEEVRGHMQSLIAQGNAKFLVVLMTAVRDGLADS